MWIVFHRDSLYLKITSPSLSYRSEASGASSGKSEWIMLNSDCRETELNIFVRSINMAACDGTVLLF